MLEPYTPPAVGVNPGDFIPTPDAHPTTFAIGVSGLLYLGWVAFRHLMRNRSNDKLQNAKDRMEENLLKALQDQAKSDRDRADKAEQERNLAMIEIGQLKGQLQVFAIQLEAVQADLVEARSELGLARQEIASMRQAMERMLALGDRK